MPSSSVLFRKCLYCADAVKRNIRADGRNKGYLKTCGSTACLQRQYTRPDVNRKKSYISQQVQGICAHCAVSFTKLTYNQKWCLICVPDAKARQFMQRYDLSWPEYETLTRKNNGLCPICQKRRASVVDHCHKTDKVRGFICQDCNHALHLVEDKESTLRALRYLGVNYGSI